MTSTTNVEPIDLPIFGRAARTVWCKRRFVYKASECETKSFTEAEDRIAGPRQRFTSRAARRSEIASVHAEAE